MANFDKAMEVVFQHEGGFVNDPDDPGGATNYGITLATLRKQGYDIGDVDEDGDIDEDDVRRLPKKVAKKVYKNEYWDKHQFYKIKSDDVATKLFDLAVNMGPRQAILITQRCVRACSDPITEDGIVGPETLNAINSVDNYVYLCVLREGAASFYRRLVDKNSNFEKFERGWLNRAYS